MAGKFDKIAWDIIHKMPPPRMPNRKGLAQTGRPKDFAELEVLLSSGEDWRIAFPMFLDEFYCFKTPDFFAVEPSGFFDVRMRAWLAGVAEYLCRRFGLPVPEWTEKPEYFLAEFWKRTDDAGEPEFRRRNVGYNPRHLIRL